MPGGWLHGREGDPRGMPGQTSGCLNNALAILYTVPQSYLSGPNVASNKLQLPASHHILGVVVLSHRHILTVRSSEPEMTRLPFVQTDDMGAAWPSNMWWQLPVVGFHTRRV